MFPLQIHLLLQISFRQTDFLGDKVSYTCLHDASDFIQWENVNWVESKHNKVIDCPNGQTPIPSK